MKTEILDFCDHLMGVGFNGVWQGLLITILVAAGLRLLGPTNAATRHAIWFVTMLICVGLLPAQFLRRSSLFEQPAGFAEQNASTTAAPAPKRAELLFPQTAEPSGVVYPAQATAETKPAPQTPRQLKGDGPAEVEVSTQTVGPRALVGTYSASIEPVERPLVTESVLPEVTNREPARSLATPGTSWGTNWRVPFGVRPPRWTGLVVLSGWLILAVVRMGILAYRLVQIRRLKRCSKPASHALTETFDALRGRLGIKRPVRLRLSSSNNSPALLGFLHPVITIPEREFDGASVLDAEKVLWHELAHLRRYDDWANLLQNVIQAVAFFHPAVPWISRKLSLEREIACDDNVLQGGKPQAYALLLANLAGRFQGNRALPAPGVTTTRSQLHQRINMILNTKRNTSPRLARARLGLVSTSVLALAALAVYCGPRIVLAQDNADKMVQPTNANDNRNATLSAASGAGLVAAAEPPLAPAAATAPVAPEAGIAISGPRVKPEISVGVSAPQPVVIATPTPTGVDNVAVVTLPSPPAPAYVPGHLVASGHKGHPVDSADPKALEARLERVEAMLNELLAQRRPDAVVWGKPSEDMKRRAEEIALLERKKVELDAIRVEQDAKRDAKMRLKAGTADARKQREACSKALETLQHSREQLEKQMEKLDQQIEKLEQEQENLDENSRSSEEQVEPKEGK